MQNGLTSRSAHLQWAPVDARHDIIVAGRWLFEELQNLFKTHLHLSRCMIFCEDCYKNDLLVNKECLDSSWCLHSLSLLHSRRLLIW